MVTAYMSLTVGQREFAQAHDVGRVEMSFLVGYVFMYHERAPFTDRWLVRSDGSAAEHERFRRV